MKKPAGFRAFHKLAKKIVAVPKDKVDAAIARERAAKKRVLREGNKPLDREWFDEQRRKQATRAAKRSPQKD